MDKKAYFLAALAAGLHTKRQWVLSAFSLNKEAPDAFHTQSYDYRVVARPGGYSFIDPTLKAANPDDPVLWLTKIDDAQEGRPLILALETLMLDAGEVGNLTTAAVTTYGNALFNACCILRCFGKKIPFITGLVSISKIQGMLAKSLETPPADASEHLPTAFYTDEVDSFAEGLSYLCEFNSILTWGVTEKAISPPTGVKELKKALFEKYKGQLSDPIVFAKIMEELYALDDEFLKGDEAENFLLSSKTRKIVRAKMFLAYGIEEGLVEGQEVEAIMSSLSEGWEMDRIPTMFDSLRNGSYLRGAETMLGGEATKWLYRASSNVMVLDEDCGSKVGQRVKVTKINAEHLVKLRLMDGSIIEDDAAVQAMMGKVIEYRSPMFCHLSKTDYCRHCMGEVLGRNPDGASTAIAKLGSGFLTLSLKKMHGKERNLKQFSLEQVLS